MKKLRLLLIACAVFVLFSAGAHAKQEQKYFFDYIGGFSEGRAVAGLYEWGWTYGYIDNKGEVKVQPGFKAAGNFSCGAAYVGVADPGKSIKYGFIDKEGGFLIKPQYDEAKDFLKIPGTGEEVAVVGIGDKNSRKYGFIKKDGTYFAEPRYDGVAEYSNMGNKSGYTVVYNEKNGKKQYGILDSKGKLIVEAKYSFISIGNYEAENGYISVTDGDLFGFFDIKNNKLVEPQFSSNFTILDEGLRISKIVDGKEKIGFYFFNGSIVEPKYDWLWYWDSEEVLNMTQLNGKYGLLGKSGKEILPPIYDEIRDLGTWAQAVLNGETLLITKNGQVLDDKKFDSVSGLENFDLLMVEVGGKKGLLDPSDNSYLVEPVYDEIDSFRDGYARVTLNGRKGIVDRQGKVVLEPVYEYIYTNFYMSHIREGKKNADGSMSYSYRDDKSQVPVVKVKKDGKEYFLNSDFTAMKKSPNSAIGDFDTIGMFEAGAARIEKAGKVGYVREDFSYIVKPVWDGAFRAEKDGEYAGWINIEKDGKWGVVFMDGTAVEPIAQNIMTVSEEIIAVNVSDSWRYIDKKGKYLNNEEYNYVHPFSEGKGRVQKKNPKTGLFDVYFLDTKGKKVSGTYLSASDYKEGLAFVFDADGGRYIDHQGKTIFGEKLNLWTGFAFKNGQAPAGGYSQKAEKILYGILKKDGTWLIEPVFDNVEDYGNGVYKYYLNGKQAEISANGKIKWK